MTTVSDNNQQAENFFSRGIGLEFGLVCFVCGEKPEVEFDPFNNIAAFVDNKEAGERIVSMFAQQGSTVSLDYRDFEPHRVQVKVGGCRSHVHNLKRLHKMVKKDHMITPTKITDAKNM